MARVSQTRRRHSRHRNFEREHRRIGYARPTNLQFAGTGDGVLSGLGVEEGAPNETWTVAFTDATNFTVTGSVSGAQAAGVVGTPYDSTGEVLFTITAGATPFVAADQFTFDTDVQTANQAALQPSRAAQYVIDADARLTPDEQKAGIHDAFTLAPGDASAVTFEDVDAAAAATDIGLT